MVILVIALDMAFSDLDAACVHVLNALKKNEEFIILNPFLERSGQLHSAVCASSVSICYNYSYLPTFLSENKIHETYILGFLWLLKMTWWFLTLSEDVLNIFDVWNQPKNILVPSSFPFKTGEFATTQHDYFTWTSIFFSTILYQVCFFKKNGLCEAYHLQFVSH